MVVVSRLTRHSREDTVSTTKLELGVVELGDDVLGDLAIVLLGEVTNSSSRRESHERLLDVSGDLLLQGISTTLYGGQLN
jgi:hypothetical protein